MGEGIKQLNALPCTGIPAADSIYSKSRAELQHFPSVFGKILSLDGQRMRFNSPGLHLVSVAYMSLPLKSLGFLNVLILRSTVLQSI